MIVPELINIIVNYLYYIEDIMKIYNLSKYTQKNIKITNLYDIDKSKLKYIRQNTIEQDMFKYLEKLDCKDNIYIESLSISYKFVILIFFCVYLLKLYI